MAFNVHTSMRLSGVICKKCFENLKLVKFHSYKIPKNSISEKSTQFPFRKMLNGILVCMENLQHFYM